MMRGTGGSVLPAGLNPGDSNAFGIASELENGETVLSSYGATCESPERALFALRAPFSDRPSPAGDRIDCDSALIGETLASQRSIHAGTAVDPELATGAQVITETVSVPKFGT